MALCTYCVMMTDAAILCGGMCVLVSW